jgi:hypothetical protein
MQTTPAKRGAPEGTDFSGAIRVNEFGNYAKAHIKMRCVDKGDNARMLAWCDIGATPESIGMSGVAGQSGVAAVGKASQKEAPVVWGDRGLGWEIDAGVRSQPYMITKPALYDYHESGLRVLSSGGKKWVSWLSSAPRPAKASLPT